MRFHEKEGEHSVTSASSCSTGKPSMTLMFRVESEFMMAKPPLAKIFLGSLPLTTSITPGLSWAMMGTWLARIPMSPAVEEMFTWSTSVLPMMVYRRRKKKKRRFQFSIRWSQSCHKEKRRKRRKGNEERILQIRRSHPSRGTSERD